MAAKKGLGSVKRFGVRYGRTVKHKRAKVEKEQKSKHKCPYCSKPKLWRVSFGVWECQKCRSKFTARAYTVGKPVSFIEEALQFKADFPEAKSKKLNTEEDVEA